MSFKPFLAYSASAGSGKTFALAVRYIALLFMGESPRNILAATFTNKAAAEMRQRVIASLRELSSEKNRVFADAICAETGLSREQLLAKQPNVLESFLASSSYIVTLDSFFSSILRSASLELGLEPDFATKEKPHEKLESHFLEELQREGLLGALVKLSMDIEDKRFSKIFDLMQDFYRVDPLLPEPDSIRFNLKKQEEEIETLRVQMIRTLEAAGASQRAIGQFVVEDPRALFSKKLFEKATLGEHSWYKKSINEEAERLYARLKESLLRWARAKESIVLHNLFTVYDYYKNATISSAKYSGILSFDDLSYFTYRLLHESISREFLFFKIDSKFRHILLDEFQDTSTLQFLLLKPLIDEIFSGLGQSEFKSFFYVGDTKQSLYRFRGGVEELFDLVAEQYGITVEPMDTNYRSSRQVVEQVNRWFDNVMPGYLPQRCREGAEEGYVEVVEAEEPVAEAVSQAKHLMEKGVAIDSLAFLVSTNKDGVALQEACEKEGIATLLQTTSSLKSIPKIAALAAMAEYLFDGARIDAEALLERVGSSLKDVDSSWFIPTMEPVEVLDRLVRDFGYFDGDPNIVKLLEFASHYATLPEFIEEFKSSSIAVASHSVHGARIMTIHGSKGLEFENVIVMDRLTRKSSDRSPLIYHYNDTLYIEEIFYRIAKRENFDEAYRQLLEKRKISESKDHLNVLYVALTRAVSNLIVIKKPKESIFDAIALEPMRRGAVRIGHSEPEAEVKGGADTSMTALSYYGSQKRLERSENGEQKNYDAILFGTALHYTLEMMGGFEAESLNEAIAALRNRFGVLLQEEGVEEIRQRIERLIENESFRLLLEGAEVSKEQPIAYEGEIRQIDLLLEYEASCLVVDYKSSLKYASHHQKQVAQYQRAIEKITGKQTDGVIVYLLENETRLVNLK